MKTYLEILAPLVAKYLAGTDTPARELVFRRFADSDDEFTLAAAFYVVPDAARYTEGSTGPGYRYVRVGIEPIAGRKFKIGFIQRWYLGKTEDEATLHEDVFDVH